MNFSCQSTVRSPQSAVGETLGAEEAMDWGLRTVN